MSSLPAFFFLSLPETIEVFNCENLGFFFFFFFLSSQADSSARDGEVKFRGVHRLGLYRILR